MFFEGTEKKFELWVDSSIPSLRERPDELWSRVARAGRAQILNTIDNGRCRAMLLSESSLFVLDHKVVMITCGLTRLADAVDALLEEISPEQVAFFAYERKNEVSPHDQPTSFFDDVRQLRRSLPGRSWQFGFEDEHHLYLFQCDRPAPEDTSDLTVEILMHGLPEDVRDLFGPEGRDRRELAGVTSLVPGFEVDDHDFEPAGYSLNGIRGEQYWTLHVTPHPVRSYASFEMNLRDRDELDAAIRRVPEVFRPRAFDVVTFDAQERPGLSIPGYRSRSQVGRRMECGYHVDFHSFHRPQDGPREPAELAIDPGHRSSGSET